MNILAFFYNSYMVISLLALEWTWLNIYSLARGKRRGFSPAAAARHRSWTRVPRILSFSGWLQLSVSLFDPLFSRFWNRTSPHFEIGLQFNIRFQIGEESRIKTWKYGFPTLQRCGKRSANSKQIGKKGENWCPISEKIEKNKMSDLKINQIPSSDRRGWCPVLHTIHNNNQIKTTKIKKK